jgi:Tfp pilus assembly protein PilF
MEQIATSHAVGRFGSRNIQNRPDATARTYTERAFTHVFEGEYDRAEIAYRTALCLNPLDGDMREDLESIGRALCRLRE